MIMLLLHKNVSHFTHEWTCTLGLYITEIRRIASALLLWDKQKSMILLYEKLDENMHLTGHLIKWKSLVS